MPLIQDRDREVGLGGDDSIPDEPGHPHDADCASLRQGHQRDVVTVIDVGEVGRLPIVQVGCPAQESSIARGVAQQGEGTLQLGRVATVDRPNPDAVPGAQLHRLGTLRHGDLSGVMVTSPAGSVVGWSVPGTEPPHPHSLLRANESLVLFHQG